MEDLDKSCCAPSRFGEVPNSSAPNFIQKTTAHGIICWKIPGGNGLQGTDDPQITYDGEEPLRQTKIKPFLMSETTITNAQFYQFIQETGYKTTAEEWGWSFVFHSQVPESVDPTLGIDGLEWWRQVYGANWRDLNGPGTQEKSWHPDHPVVQVSYHDAMAFAQWAAGRLPTEAEWEHAARGGLGDVKYPWGDDEPTDTTNLNCNNWQGVFPDSNTEADGYFTTAPAKSFEPNRYGLYNMVGNVWEWTRTPFTIKSQKREVKARLAGLKGYMVGKGGSFLCHKSYCYRYRIAARSPQDKTSTTPHQGFRLVWDE